MGPIWYLEKDSFLLDYKWQPQRKKSINKLLALANSSKCTLFVWILTTHKNFTYFKSAISRNSRYLDKRKDDR